MIPFSKYQGTGNDFVLIDNREVSFPSENTSLIAKICSRKWGIGADGLILLENSSSADFRMRIFNSDGREAESCGNGLRCLMQFLVDLGLSPHTYSIELMQGQVKIAMRERVPVVFLEEPQNLKISTILNLPTKEETIHLIHTGVPHGVLFIKELEKIPVFEKGKEIRCHPLYAPCGINVNFAEVLQDNTIRVRTYERGVEGETLACGTGAAAVALIAHELYRFPSPVSVKFPGGVLQVFFEKRKGSYQDIQLMGPAEHVFSGSIKIRE